MVCGAVFTGLTAMDRETPPQDAFAVVTAQAPAPRETITETVPILPSTTGSAPPSGPALRGDFERVSGPNGMTTHIPAGWPTKRAPGPAAMQADDPGGTGRFLRYGGSETSVSDSYGVHVDYQQQFSANKTAFVSIRLERTTVRGYSAVDWEFEYDTSEGRRHVRSIYWLALGYEYFVYASSPVPIWPQTQDILDVMLDNATP